MSKSFRKLANAAGFPVLRLHDLGHTHATLLLRRGMPVNEVAARLGHYNANVTLSICAHAIPECNEEVIAAAGLIMKIALGWLDSERASRGQHNPHEQIILKQPLSFYASQLLV